VSTITGIVEQAVRLANLGWRLLPLFSAGPRTKQPRIPQWPQRASADPHRVHNWASLDAVVAEDGSAGVAFGVACGRGSGFFVVDVDPRHGGDTAWAVLVEQNGGIPETVEALTGGGGRHYYWRLPDDVTVGNSSGTLGIGVDVKGEGGQVVLPPAPHPSGNTYAWIRAPWDHPMAFPPQWLVDLVSGVNGVGSKPAFPDVTKPLTENQNEQLFTVSLELLRHGMTEENVLSYLMWLQEQGQVPDADPTNPWTEVDFRKIVQSAAKHETATQEQSSRAARTFAKVTGIETVPRYVAKTGMSTVDNVARFVAAYGETVAYNPESGWYLWDGRRWVHDLDGLRVTHLATKVVERMFLEATQLGGKAGDALHKWVTLVSRSPGQITATARLARGVPEILRGIADFDDPIRTGHLLNTQNGVLDLVTGELRPHRPDLLITGVVPTEWDPTAKCPTWESTLALAFDGDREMIEFVQRAMGYTLSGDVSEQCLFVCWGVNDGGQNGKSTLFEGLYRTLGQDYAAMSDPEVLTGDQSAYSLASIARLRAKRYVGMNELSPGKRLNGSLVKQLTGGDTIQAKFMRMNPFEYLPQYKVWLRANHKPSYAGEDGALRRRLLLIPFEHRIPPEKRVERREIDSRLNEERSGILAWLHRGFVEYRRQGLNPPATVLAKTIEYHEENDPWGQFVREYLVVTPGTGDFVNSQAMRTLITAYLREEHGWRNDPSARIISLQLDRLLGTTPTVRRDNGVVTRVWENIRFTEEAAARFSYQGVSTPWVG